MRKVIILFFFFLLLGCNQSFEQTPPIIGATNTVSPTATFTSTETFTPTPTQTQAIIFTPTSNFNNLVPQIVTPSLPQICPAIGNNPVSLPDDPKEYFLSRNRTEKIKEFESLVVDVLNQGGMRDLLRYFTSHEIKYYTADLTNDGSDELVVDFAAVNIFGCKDGQYQNLRTFTGPYGYIHVLAIRDLNLNGVADLAIALQTCFHCDGIKVYEWDGDYFNSLVLSRWIDYSENKIVSYGIAELPGYSDLSVEDINRDGFYELILDGGIPSYFGGISGADGPWRAEKLIFMWNGENFVWYSQEFYPPNFRFEAVFDGDIQTLRGLYDEALVSYQSAIFDDKLISWDNEIWRKMVYEREDLSYPDIQKMPFNQNEYDQLSAYSRYRIMILHLIQGWEGDAKVIYDTLIELYPENTIGYPYVEMAKAFWNEYQNSRDLYKACEKAIQYAYQNDDIVLEPFGWHGFFNPSYSPEDTCPFNKYSS